MIDPKALLPAFEAHFAGIPRAFFAPGRVNLIGEHTDYNEGFVLPVALEVGITMLAAPRNDRLLAVYSQDQDELAQVDLNHPGPGKTGHWMNYVEGVAQALVNKYPQLAIQGADLVLAGDVPSGAGLSSSAALEISTGFALLSLAGQTAATINRVELALAGQWAEHHYVGTLCGIMDQLISARATPRSALLIDCRDLSVSDVPLPPDGIAVLVTDTRKKHALASSEYNTRRNECEGAVSRLRPALGEIRALRDVTEENLKQYASLLPEILLRRARHVVSENARTLAAAMALRQGDFRKVGSLFVESHRSLQYDYEVSAPELDHLVDEAMEVDGVLGARMTGGGFGGSTVTLVEASHLQRLKDRLRASYFARFGHEPAFLVTFGGNGSRELCFE